MGIRKTAHAKHELWCHLVWGTKYRKKIFKEGDIKECAKRLFREIAGHYDIEIRDIEVMEDHVHMLASALPRMAPLQIYRYSKAQARNIYLRSIRG